MLACVLGPRPRRHEGCSRRHSAVAARCPGYGKRLMRGCSACRHHPPFWLVLPAKVPGVPVTQSRLVRPAPQLVRDCPQKRQFPSVFQTQPSWPANCRSFSPRPSCHRPADFLAGFASTRYRLHLRRCSPCRFAWKQSAPRNSPLHLNPQESVSFQPSRSAQCSRSFEGTPLCSDRRACPHAAECTRLRRPAHSRQRARQSRATNLCAMLRRASTVEERRQPAVAERTRALSELEVVFVPVLASAPSRLAPAFAHPLEWLRRWKGSASLSRLSLPRAARKQEHFSAPLETHRRIETGSQGPWRSTSG